MKKVWIVFLCAIIALAGYSQGIRFEQGLSWQQIKEKAKKENKLIFLDCYATWCKPCKLMDSLIYTIPAVGNFFNEKFISVKVQMDKKSTDPAHVQEWYSTADELAKKYNIAAYPTYLFFNSDGEAVHKDVAFKSLNDFTQMGKYSMEPDKQYYSKLKNYRSGNKNYDSLPELINFALFVKDEAIAAEMTRDYVEHYSKGKSIEPLLQPVHIDFIARRMMDPKTKLGSGDAKLFSLFYKHGHVVDSVIKNEGLSKAVVEEVAKKEIVLPYLLQDMDWKKPKVENPDWNKLQLMIAKKFGKEYSENPVLFTKMKWYKTSRTDWNKLTLIYIDYFEQNKTYLDDRKANSVNDVLYNNVFQHITDKEILSQAAALQYKLLEAAKNKTGGHYANNIDTYSNLLYKSGSVEKAIEWQSKCVELDSVAAAQGNLSPRQEFAENLRKMKAGLPTWKTDN